MQIESCSSRGNDADDGNSRVEDFGIILLDDAGGAYTGVANPLHVTYGGGWHFPEVTLTETACRLFAFHPFLSIQGQELPVSLTTQTDYMASGELRLDWLNNRADIEMAHLLSLMEVTVDGSDACSLSLDGVPTEGMYDLADGTLSINRKPEPSSPWETGCSCFPDRPVAARRGYITGKELTTGIFRRAPSSPERDTAMR